MLERIAVRLQIEREIERLQRDFDKLPNIPCCVRIERSTIYSRYPNRRKVPTKAGRIRAYVYMGSGLEFPPVPIRSVEDLARATVFYDLRGKPVVNSNGHPLIIDPGWRHSYLLEIEGSDAETKHVIRTIERASDWAKNRWDILKPLLFPNKIVLNNGSRLWCDVVLAAAIASDSATLRHMNMIWVQSKKMERVEINAWKIRNQWGIERDLEDEDTIGDDPEDVFTETQSLIEDSFEVLDYLKREMPGCLLGGRQTDQQESVRDGGDDDLTICREALRAVVEGDLAGVLGAAGKVPSREKVSEVMRNMLAADPARYEWSADEWVRQLGCTKQTIVGNNKKEIPPCDAWAERMAWRESNKQNRFPKKPKEKN